MIFVDVIIILNFYFNVCDESVDYLFSYDELFVIFVVEVCDDMDEIYLFVFE